MENAQCPDHPEREATGTCLRCGRFVCEACSGAALEVRCPVCRQRALRELPSGAGAAKVASALVLAHGLVHVVVALALPKLEAGSPRQALALAVALVLLLATFVGSAVPYLIWLHSAARAGRALGLGTSSPGWAVACWFIPFVQLVSPYRVVAALARGLGGRASAALAPWWALSIGGSLLRLLSLGPSDPEASAAGSPDLETLAAGSLAGAAVTCVMVMASLQQELDARRTSTALPGAGTAPGIEPAPTSPTP